MPENSVPDPSPRTLSPVPLSAVRVAAYVVAVAAGGWFLLGELTVLFRPLLFAVLSTYTLMPVYLRLRKHLPTSAAVGVLSVAVTAVFAAVAVSVTASALTLSENESVWRKRAMERVREVSDWAHGFSVVGPVPPGQRPTEEVFAERVTSALVEQLRAVAIGLPEIFAGVLYLLFLLVESARFPERVRRGYAPERAADILTVFAQINTSIIAYLRAKVVSSLWLAVPVGVVLVVFGVPFALLWAALTFVCNFIPYLGSVVAYTLPMLFATVEFGFTPQLAVVAGAVFAVHLLGAAVVEPLILGRAVGLSPLVILASLSVWGILWGIPGMFLAVPLTVVLKIVFEHLPATRPVAQLLSDG
jgi:AI-2 transport protein TqsA